MDNACVSGAINSAFADRTHGTVARHFVIEIAGVNNKNVDVDRATP